MDKKLLSKLLKEAGSSFKEFEAEVKKQPGRTISYGDGTSVVSCSILWDTTEQGHSYWDAVHNYIESNRCPLALPGKATPEYAVYKCGDMLEIGCQILKKKHQKVLFKILADQLGYEIEG